MTAVFWWFRLDFRRRWRSLLVLALLVAFAAGTVMMAVAGARRGAGALDRLTAVTLPATVQVLPNDPDFDWDAVRRLPGVESVGEVGFGAYELDGVPVEGPIIADDTVTRTIERPVVLDGRLAEPARLDEAMVTPRFVESYGTGVGDTVTLRLYTPETLDRATMDWRGPASEGTVTAADGPTVPVRIVGVVRSFMLADYTGAPGWLIPSAALYAEHRASLLGSSGATSALVRLETGGEGVADFKAALTALTGRTDISVWNEAATTAFEKRIVGVETTALIVFAVAAGAAAVFLIGPAIVRYVGSTIDDLRVLRAQGMSPRQSVTAAVVGPALAGVAGAGAGVAAAVLASRWFPIGTAALREPAPGVHADRFVLSIGWATVVVAVAAGSAGAALVALRASRSVRPPRRSSIATAVAHAGAPPPVVLGTRLALEPGQGRHAVPVRPALVGAVVGVLGIVAALTVAAGIDDAAGNPRRYGQVHQLDARFGVAGEDRVPAERVLPILADDPDVIGVNDSRSAVAQNGGITAVVYSLDPVGDPLDLVVTTGRLPGRPGEIALAPYTASAMDVEVGGTVELAGTGTTAELTVTGLAFVPEGPENYNLDGAWVTGSGFDELFVGFGNHVAHIALREGADPGTVAERLRRAAAAVAGDVEVGPTLQRDHSVELQVVRAFPIFLAGFLTVLALGAVGHALAVAVRRRRHDLAVLRALGLTRWQCRGAVVTQAVVIALAGLVAGVPLGIAVGRSVWRYVADITVTHYVPPVALWALALVAPVAVLTAVLLAGWPAQRAASMPLGHALRAE